MEDTSSSFLSLFPTRILKFSLPDAARINLLLVDAVETEHQRCQGVQKTNQGGWHSNIDFHKRQHPAVQEFVHLAREQLSLWAEGFFDLSKRPDPDLWQIELWANRNEHGHFNRAHDHFRTGICASLFYYVRCGGNDVGGKTVIINQQSKPANIESSIPLREAAFSLTPSDGTGYVIPSWQGHEVTTYWGSIPRITLALNASHPEISVKKHGDKPRNSQLANFLRKLYFGVSHYWGSGRLLPDGG